MSGDIPPAGIFDNSSHIHATPAAATSAAPTMIVTGEIKGRRAAIVAGRPRLLMDDTAFSHVDFRKVGV